MKFGPEGVRSAVVVRVFNEALERFAESWGEFRPRVAKYLQDQKLNVPALRPLVHEPTHVVALSANVIMIAHSGGDGMADFHYVSPLALARLNQNSAAQQELEIDPVVRVVISTGYLAAILDKLATLREGTTP